MAEYSYAQLEGLWVNAGGPRDKAPLMAAIAEAESGGNSDARNPSGASGLWQILGDPFPGNVFDPATNARMAVAKYNSQGLGAWTTYTSGAYKAYMQNSTSPDTNVAGSPTATAAQASAQSSADCLVSNPVGGGVLGFLTGAPACLFSKSNARAFIGTGILLAGGGIALAGLVVAAAAAGMKALGAAGPVAEGVGGAMLLVPGLEGAGAATMAAGKAAKSGSSGKGLAAAGRGKQKKQAADEEKLRKAVGEPRENPDLETRGGVVRQDRRQRAAQRSRERRSAGSSDVPPF